MRRLLTFKKKLMYVFFYIYTVFGEWSVGWEGWPVSRTIQRWSSREVVALVQCLVSTTEAAAGKSLLTNSIAPSSTSVPTHHPACQHRDIVSRYKLPILSKPRIKPKLALSQNWLSQNRQYISTIIIIAKRRVHDATGCAIGCTGWTSVYTIQLVNLYAMHDVNSWMVGCMNKTCWIHTSGCTTGFYAAYSYRFSSVSVLAVGLSVRW